MPTFPPDRFDRPPTDLQRVGAHRAPRPGGRGWVVFLWAVVATGVLIGVGVLAMFAINNRVVFNPFAGSSTTTTPTPTPTVQPTLDPSVTVIVLNGTTVDGLAGQVGDLLVEQGWTVGARSNASSQDVQASMIYYTDPAQEGAALGLSAALNNVPIQQSDAYLVPGESRITVVLGADYTAPA
ncbi:LytR C-terminal domain-containing protein [Naasia sp. SYSU D00948]|uniref:LytR C-terminal domain-containing protein n=1 Tax=Naasia sp. SYSU D00948 TaxID=2817379 RepID=UPI001B3144ED|nr:LytR C-terminal domain-containing protein [Naasia sp. SYSU D00948]